MTNASSPRSPDPHQLRLVVLGAGGRLGQFLMHHRSLLGDDGSTVFVSRQTGPNIMSYDGALTDPGLQGLMSRLGPDGTLLNLAGLTPGQGVDAAALEKMNVGFVADLLDAAARAGVGHVCLASSAAVYGRPIAGRPAQAEDDTLSPISDYGRSKVAMEDLARRFAASHRALSVSLLRIGNVAGADQILTNAMAATDTTPMQIDQFDDGHGPLRSYLGPRDLAVMIRAILDAPREQVRTVNLALPGPVHAETLVDALSTALDRRLPWQFRPAPENAVSQVVLATDRIAALAGLSVRPDTEAHLAAQVAEMGLGAARS